MKIVTVVSNIKSFKIFRLVFFILIFFLLWVTNPTIVRATPVIDYSAPDEAKIEEVLDILITLSQLDGNSQYRIKIQIGNHEDLNKGQTLNHGTDRWVSANEPWQEFPAIASSADGFWSGVIKARLTSVYIPDVYNSVVSIKKEQDTVIYESPIGEITFTGYADNDDDTGGKGAVGEENDDEGVPTELPITGPSQDNFAGILFVSLGTILSGIYFLIKAVKI